MLRYIAALLLLLISAAAHAQLAPLPYQGSAAAGGGSQVFSGLTLTDLTVTWNAGTGARYLMIFDATALPSNGATTACSVTQSSGCLLYCSFVSGSTAAPGAVAWEWTLHPIRARNGLVAALSTGAGCGTLTVDTGADWFYSQIQ